MNPSSTQLLLPGQLVPPAAPPRRRASAVAPPQPPSLPETQPPSPEPQASLPEPPPPPSPSTPIVTPYATPAAPTSPVPTALIRSPAREPPPHPHGAGSSASSGSNSSSSSSSSSDDEVKLPISWIGQFSILVNWFLGRLVLALLNGLSPSGHSVVFFYWFGDVRKKDSRGLGFGLNPLLLQSSVFHPRRFAQPQPSPSPRSEEFPNKRAHTPDDRVAVRL